MDWKGITEKFDAVTTKLQPFIEKAKTTGYKAIDFTQKQLQNTGIALKSNEEFQMLRTEKRFILVAYDEGDLISKEMLLFAPIWGTKAWTDASQIRFLEISKNQDLVRTIGIQSPLEMRVWYTGTETFRSNDLEAIKNWWKTRCYDGKEDTDIVGEKTDMSSVSQKQAASSTESSPSDPLTGK